MSGQTGIPTTAFWIKTLKLRRHTEGGYYREVYRSNETVPSASLPPRFAGDRSLSTSIYYLLPGGEVSRLHRLCADEVWHFYAGSSLTIHIIDGVGEYHTVSLGPDVAGGDSFQTVVRHGSCFGATVNDRTSYSLVGCTVAPGFDFEDFEPCSRQRLLHEFPRHRGIIELLTVPETG